MNPPPSPVGWDLFLVVRKWQWSLQPLFCGDAVVEPCPAQLHPHPPRLLGLTQGAVIRHSKLLHSGIKLLSTLKAIFVFYLILCEKLGGGREFGETCVFIIHSGLTLLILHMLCLGSREYFISS